MKEKMKVIAPHFIVGVFSLVVVGMAGSFGLEAGYQLLLAYVLGSAAHSKVAPLVAKKINKGK